MGVMDLSTLMFLTLPNGYVYIRNSGDKYLWRYNVYTVYFHYSPVTSAEKFNFSLCKQTFRIYKLQHFCLLFLLMYKFKLSLRILYNYS